MSALRLGFEWVVSDGNELIPDTDCLVEYKLLHLNRTFYSVAPQTPGSFLEVRVCASGLSGSVEERARGADTNTMLYLFNRNEFAERRSITPCISSRCVSECRNAPLTCCYKCLVTSMRWCRTPTIRITLSVGM